MSPFPAGDDADAACDGRVLRRYQALARSAALLAIATGGMVLAGWAFELGALTRLLPGGASMKVNTAIGFVLCGIALRLQAGLRPSPLQQRLARGCALAVVLLGGLTLLEYASGHSLGIDQALVIDRLIDRLGPPPGRMAPATAGCLLALGAALLHRRSHPRLAQALASLVAILGFTVLVGYALSDDALHAFVRIGFLASLALPTAAMLLVLGLGLQFATAGQGWMAAISSSGPGGALARRLLPAIIVGVPLLSRLLLWSEQNGHYDDEFAAAAIAVMAMLALIGVVLAAARQVDRAAGEQREAHDTALRLEQLALRAEAESHLKSRLLAHLSHELRTPLNAIIGFSELLVDGRIGPLAPDQHEFVEDILGSSRQLLQQIDELLALTHAEAHRMPLAPAHHPQTGVAAEGETS